MLIGLHLEVGVKRIRPVQWSNVGTQALAKPVVSQGKLGNVNLRRPTCDGGQTDSQVTQGQRK